MKEHGSPHDGVDRLQEVAAVFLKLGTTAFGGPAAAIALMQEEVVERRKWVDRQTFLDLLGATNLIPGPNSTEMAIHLGYLRAGWPGLILGGACFILPAMLLVLGLAWGYVRYGALPEVGWLLYGVKPVILAVVAQALWALGKTAIRDWTTGVAAAAVLGGVLLGVGEVPLLFGAALMVMAVRRRVGAVALAPVFALGLGAEAAGPSLGGLAWFFLKVGSVLYGSGYVLLAFLQGDLVGRYGWLTSKQLLDAVAVGQFTPGPLFTTATFVGYLIAGWQGGLISTLAIFLPAFLFVGLLGPLMPRLRKSPWASAFLDGANAASLGLMAAVTLSLGRASLIDGPTVALFAIALGVLLRFPKVNSAWLVMGGGLAGWSCSLWR